MYSDTVISRVRESADIVDIVSGYVSLRKTGKNYVGLCPFHSEKTPSFSVNPDKQIFHCFGCGVGGDAFKFLELQEGLNFPEAVRRLAERAGIILPASRPAAGEKRSDDERKALLRIVAEAGEYFQAELAGPAGSAARAYLARRGLSAEVIKDFSLGFARNEWDGLLKHLRQRGYPEGLMEKAGLVVKRSEGEGHYDRFRGRIIFPIRDIGGQVIAFGGRVMDDGLPKYLNSPETPLYSKSGVLYCLEKAKDAARKQGYFIIVEGYLDAIACHQYGAQNAVATLGTALTEGHLRLMRRFSQKIVLIFDPDPAGVKAALRSFDLFAGSGMKVNVVSLPGGDDPDTYLKKNGAEAFSACLRQSAKFMDFVLGQVAKAGARGSIDDKVEQAAEMLGFIARLPSGIERDHYLKRTAEALGVEEQLLRQEMASRRAVPAGPAGRTGAPAVKNRRPKAEEILIHLMLRDEAAAQALKDQIRPAEFTDPVFRRLAELVFDTLVRTGALDSASLLSAAGDEDLRRLISHYSVLETEYTEAQDTEIRCRTRQDCVDAVRQQNHARAEQELMRAIREAEERRDDREVGRLQAEHQQLLLKRKELHTRS